MIAMTLHCELYDIIKILDGGLFNPINFCFVPNFLYKSFEESTKELLGRCHIECDEARQGDSSPNGFMHDGRVRS